MTPRSLRPLFLPLLVVVPFLGLQADDAETLAAASEAYCATTIHAEPTHPATVVAKVQEACALLEAEGPAAFPRFSGEGSPFIYDGTYLWVHTLADSEMLMHPIKYKMVGKKLIGLKDMKGKRFFVVMNDLVREHGEGWVEYYWPQPGTNEVVRKVSFVRGCTMSDGVEVVVGSGIYNGSPEEVAALEVH